MGNANAWEWELSVWGPWLVKKGDWQPPEPPRLSLYFSILPPSNLFVTMCEHHILKLQTFRTSCINTSSALSLWCIHTIHHHEPVRVVIYDSKMCCGTARHRGPPWLNMCLFLYVRALRVSIRGLLKERLGEDVETRLHFKTLEGPAAQSHLRYKGLYFPGPR